jgi:hypothetical protein
MIWCNDRHVTGNYGQKALVLINFLSAIYLYSDMPITVQNIQITDGWQKCRQYHGTNQCKLQREVPSNLTPINRFTAKSMYYDSFTTCQQPEIDYFMLLT